jgi:hypothetical protein
LRLRFVYASGGHGHSPCTRRILRMRTASRVETKISGSSKDSSIEKLKTLAPRTLFWKYGAWTSYCAAKMDFTHVR